jgi:hypothetical protein
MPPVAQEGAYARVTAHARESAVALGLDLAELDPAYAQTMEEDPLDGRVFVAAKWWLPSATKCGPAFDGLARHWLASGYRLIGDGRGDVLPYLWAEAPADGYRLGLEGNVQGRLVLGASSPLFWPGESAPGNGAGAVW